ALRLGGALTAGDGVRADSDPRRIERSWHPSVRLVAGMGRRRRTAGHLPGERNFHPRPPRLAAPAHLQRADDQPLSTHSPHPDRGHSIPPPHPSLLPPHQAAARRPPFEFSSSPLARTADDADNHLSASVLPSEAPVMATTEAAGRMSHPISYHPEANGEGCACNRFFWLWLLVRTLVWVLIAVLTRPNASLDTIEWLCWGREWCLGYSKHPPLPAWLGECFFRLTPGSLLGVYVLSYATSAICLWSAWRLAREILPARLALIAALCLEGLVYLNYGSAEFNNN